MNPLPPLTKAQLAELETSIATHGVLEPITVLPDGQIVDGHHRVQIATRLGVECPRRVVELDADRVDVVALALNVVRRQLGLREWKDAIAEMRNKGMSTRQIAEATGVERTAIRRSSSAGAGAPALDERRRKIVDKRGYTVPAHKPSPSELARRRDAVSSLWQQGYTANTIGEAVGIHPTAVHEDLKATGLPRGPKRYKESATPPKPVEWHDPPAHVADKQPKMPQPVDLPATYKSSSVVKFLASMARELRELNAEHCFAGDVADAREANDRDWLQAAELTLVDVEAYVARLRGVLGDPTARSHDASRRDDVARIAQFRRRSS